MARFVCLDGKREEGRAENDRRKREEKGLRQRVLFELDRIERFSGLDLNKCDASTKNQGFTALKPPGTYELES